MFFVNQKKVADRTALLAARLLEKLEDFDKKYTKIWQFSTNTLGISQTLEEVEPATYKHLEKLETSFKDKF
uniref:Uncharacterized protein n=1 Tax=Rhizophagus irregularis (strain DAOM 181602 / DAOM 197198 / MUCL 43194) TaxID=747089 RepID=U9UMT7_RHIID